MKGLFSLPASWRLLTPFLFLSGMGLAAPQIYAADGNAVRSVEHITLRNGFDLVCDHRELSGDKVRLYTQPGDSGFIEVAEAEIASVEAFALPALPNTARDERKPPVKEARGNAPRADLTAGELREVLSSAGTLHHLDVNLLASVVRAESGGHSRAVSKAGAQGLMQLMPKTAALLGVTDSFEPEANVSAGTTYLDFLLTRYHDNLAFALAAYNAGPETVDRWHGVPPYRETRIYVARIIRDFNASVRASRLALPSRNAVAQASVSPPPVSEAVAP